MVQWLRLCFQSRGKSSVPGLGTKIPHATQHGTKNKKIKPTKQNVIRLLYKNKYLLSLPEEKHGDNLSFGPPLQKVPYTW